MQQLMFVGIIFNLTLGPLLQILNNFPFKFDGPFALFQETPHNDLKPTTSGKGGAWNKSGNGDVIYLSN
jgi:hypothetical protein